MLDWYGWTALALWFVVVVAFLFLWNRLCKLNDTWREPPPDPPPSVRRVRVPYDWSDPKQGVA